MEYNALVAQWLRLHASKAGHMGSIPGWVTKIPHAFMLGGVAKREKN